jgi:hypothetical protein
MRGRDSLGILGMGVLAVICCARLPAVLAFAGSLTVVGLLGGGLTVAVVGFAAMVMLRTRDRRGCADRASRRGGDL